MLTFKNELIIIRKERQMTYIRPSWDEYFVNILKEVGKRSTCDRARNSGGGCVIVKDRQILATGYAGSPPGSPHCDDVGHELKSTTHADGSITQHCVRTAHSEQNAICQAAKHGIAINGATLYCFMTPCYVCAKLIVTAGIKRVVACQDYHAADDSKRVFKESGVHLEILKSAVAQYENQKVEAK